MESFTLQGATSCAYPPAHPSSSLPPDAGPRIKTWHVLRYLVERGNQVTLASFLRPEEKEHIPVLREMCEQVLTVPIRRSRSTDAGHWLRSHLSGRPFLVERDDILAMRRLVGGVVSSGEVEVIHADQLTMAQFALPSDRSKINYPNTSGLNRPGQSAGSNGRHRSPRPFLVFDAYNATWTLLDRMHRNVSWPLKPVLALEMQRVKRYEGSIIRRFDHTLAVSEIDRQALLQAANSLENTNPVNADCISVIPIAVDTAQLQPIRRRPDTNNILTLGTLHYPPNADGIRWLIRQVFLLIRQAVTGATLTIIGKNPPSDFARVASKSPEAITVTGYVPDLTPFLERATVVVIPVLAGGGMRVRILEALSRAQPVVTTSIGLEGIEAKPGEDVLVADTPDGFAAAVVQVLNDRHLQERLSSNGRRLAVTRYDWQVVLKQLDTVYQTAGQERRAKTLQEI